MSLLLVRLAKLVVDRRVLLSYPASMSMGIESLEPLCLLINDDQENDVTLLQLRDREEDALDKVRETLVLLTMLCVSWEGFRRSGEIWNS